MCIQMIYINILTPYVVNHMYETIYNYKYNYSYSNNTKSSITFRNI